MEIPPPTYSPPPPGPYAAPRKGVSPWVWVGIGCAGMCVCVGPVLAAILFPVFSQAKIAAQQTACLTNVKRSSLAMVMYASDYDEILPSAARWMDQTKPYGRDPKIYQCPLVHDGHGYAMNDALSKKSLAKIDAPHSVVAIFETDDLSYNAHGKPNLSQPGPRHGSRSVGYADGSTKKIKNTSR